MKTNKITKTGILASAAFILQVIGSFAGIKVAGFLEIEISDFPAIIASFAYGPFFGVMVEFIKNLLHCTMSSTGFVGELANFLINGSFVFTLGAVYKKNRTKSGAVLSLFAGGIVLVITAIFANLYILLPLYLNGADFSTKLNLVLCTITPFNAARAVVLGILTMLSYKKLRFFFKKFLFWL